MADQLLAVLLGAAVASVVPLVTLRITHAQWRLEKHIDLLRRKKEDLERMNAEIFEQLPEALQARSYPITMMGKISVHASEEVRKLYYDHMDSKERDETTMKHLLLEMAVASNRHIASVGHQIETLLK